MSERKRKEVNFFFCVDNSDNNSFFRLGLELSIKSPPPCFKLPTNIHVKVPLTSKREGQGLKKSLPGPGQGPSPVLSLPAPNLPLVTPSLLPPVLGSVPLVPYEVLHLSSLSSEPVQASFTILSTELELATALSTSPCHDVHVPDVQVPHVQVPDGLVESEFEETGSSNR